MNFLLPPEMGCSINSSFLVIIIGNDYIMGLLHNLGDGCRGQNRGRDGRGTATGGPR